MPSWPPCLLGRAWPRRLPVERVLYRAHGPRRANFLEPRSHQFTYLSFTLSVLISFARQYEHEQHRDDIKAGLLFGRAPWRIPRAQEVLLRVRGNSSTLHTHIRGAPHGVNYLPHGVNVLGPRAPRVARWVNLLFLLVYRAARTLANRAHTVRYFRSLHRRMTPCSVWYEDVSTTPAPIEVRKVDRAHSPMPSTCVQHRSWGASAAATQFALSAC